MSVHPYPWPPALRRPAYYWTKTNWPLTLVEKRGIGLSASVTVTHPLLGRLIMAPESLRFFLRLRGPLLGRLIMAPESLRFFLRLRGKS